MKTNKNLKKLFMWVAIVFPMALLQVSCTQSSGRSGKGSSYSWIMDARCLFSPGTCDSIQYDYDPKFSSYEHDRDDFRYRYKDEYDYFCGCHSRQIPVYHEQWGLGCVSRFSLEQSVRRPSKNLLVYRYQELTEALVLFRDDSKRLPGYVRRIQGYDCTKEVLRSCELSADEAGECGPQSECINVGLDNRNTVGICVKDDI